MSSKRCEEEILAEDEMTEDSDDGVVGVKQSIWVIRTIDSVRRKCRQLEHGGPQNEDSNPQGAGKIGFS